LPKDVVLAAVDRITKGRERRIANRGRQWWKRIEIDVLIVGGGCFGPLPLIATGRQRDSAADGCRK